MKSNFNILLLLSLFLASGFNLNAQYLKKRHQKNLDRLYNTDWYIALEKNREEIEGNPLDGKGAIYSYLEHVKKHPECVNAEKFSQTKAQYGALVNKYNSLIQFIIDDIDAVETIDDLKEIKINTEKYKKTYNDLVKEIPTFINGVEADLANLQDGCQRAASTIPVEFILDQIVIPVIKWMANRKLEEFKLIVIREVEKLKLDPIDTWDTIEAFLRNPEINIQTKSTEEVYGANEFEHCKTLRIKPENCYAVEIIELAYNKEKEEVNSIISSLDQNDSKAKEYYQQNLEDIENAKSYLLKLSCKENDNTGTKDCQQLKTDIQTLIDNSDGCVPDSLLEMILKHY